MARRKYYLDLLRLIAAFLVIVNHTNSEVFTSLDPENSVWWISVSWFFLCKTAVPIFVMITGALLLDRQDSYKQLFCHRVARIAAALVLFSLILYLLGGGRSVGGFLLGVWQCSISTPLWYLYMYIALLLAMPILQKFVRLAKPRDIWYVIAVSAVLISALPLVRNLGAPALTQFIETPSIFGEYVGILFTGYAISHASRESVRRRGLGLLAWACLLLPIAFAVLMTADEFRLYSGVRMRLDRSSLLTTALPAAAIFFLVRRYFGDERSPAGKGAKLLEELGGTAFGVYLTHLILIRFAHPVYMALSEIIGRMAGMVAYEVIIFVVCVAAVWAIRKIPIMKKLF